MQAPDVSSAINNKKVPLILTLPPVLPYRIVNKNTLSQVTKLLIQAQFKIFPLQFFFIISPF